MPKVRKAIIVTAGSVATIAVIIDAIGRMQTAEQLLPPAYSKYLPIIYLTGFVTALLLLREQNAEDLREAERTPDLTVMQTTQLRQGNEIAKVEQGLRQTIDEQKEEIKKLNQRKFRQLSVDQSRVIASRVRTWSGQGKFRNVIILASPHAHDGAAFAGQIRIALEGANIRSNPVEEFTWGNPADNREQFEQLNETFREMHSTGLTIFGSNEAHADCESLGALLFQAFQSARVDVVFRPGPPSIGGSVAVVVGVSDPFLESHARARKLTKQQQLEITRVVEEGFAKLKTELSRFGWSENDISQPLSVKLIALGNEQETLSFRSDFANAFKAGGFELAFGEISRIETPAFQSLVGRISVIEGDPGNVVRLFVIEAIKAAGFTPNDVEFLPIVRGGISTDYGSVARPAATLVIGPSA